MSIFSEVNCKKTPVSKPPPEATAMAAVTDCLNSSFNWIRSRPGPMAQGAYDKLATFFAATVTYLHRILTWMANSRIFFTLWLGIGLGCVVGNSVALLLPTFSNPSMVKTEVAVIAVALAAHIGLHCYLGRVAHTIQYLRGWTGWMAEEDQPFRTVWFTFGFQFLVNAMFTGSFHPEVILVGGIIMCLTFFKLVAAREDSNRVSTAVISQCALAGIFVWWNGYGLGHAIITLVLAAIGGICLLSQTDVELNLVPAV